MTSYKSNRYANRGQHVARLIKEKLSDSDIFNMRHLDLPSTNDTVLLYGLTSNHGHALITKGFENM